MCLSGLVKKFFDIFFYKMRTSRKVRVTLLWLHEWNSKIFLWGITICLRIQPLLSKLLCQWTPREPVSAAWTDYTSTAKVKQVSRRLGNFGVKDLSNECSSSRILTNTTKLSNATQLRLRLGSAWAYAPKAPTEVGFFFCSRLFAMKDYLTLLYLISKRWEIIPTFIWKSNACA